MQIVYDDERLLTAMEELAGPRAASGGRPLPNARWLATASSRMRWRWSRRQSATHTGEWIVGGVMEHIEEAGLHSGDSACAIPPQTLSADMVAHASNADAALGDALDVRGLLNVSTR